MSLEIGPAVAVAFDEGYVALTGLSRNTLYKLLITDLYPKGGHGAGRAR